jgi:CheY-like chemotaxis protein
MEKILFVDDELSILRLYKEEFSEGGYEVILANNGKEALMKYRTEHPELVVMDMRMPGMDGIEALTKILGRDRQASIVINSAFPQHRENFMTWGAEAYLIKSSDLGELKQTVREVLDKRQFAKAA